MYTRKVNKESFKLQFLNDFKGFLQLENKTEINLMHIIWRDSTEEPILANKELKEQWAEELACSLGTVNNTLTKLVNKKLIKSSSRSVYYPNSDYFAQGLSRTIKYEIIE